MFDIKADLQQRADATNRELDRILPILGTRPARLHAAMRHSVFAGGKRLRPALCIAACEACGGEVQDAMNAACALELLHTYTLIHDDLPAMDDDTLRRGKPTCHIAFDEATAILAGDALLTLAFEVLANSPLRPGSEEEMAETPQPTPACGHPSEGGGGLKSPPREGCRNGGVGSSAVRGRSSQSLCALVVELARASGSQGVIGGQAEDLAAEGKDPSADLVEYIHQNKTAALIRAACVMGGICAGASFQTLENLAIYGENIGLAFQITDDLLDESSTVEELGKDIGSDRARGKMTYPTVYGAKRAKEKAITLIAEAKNAIIALPGDSTVLDSLADFIIQRTL